MITRYYRRYRLPVVSLLCMTVSCFGPFTVHAGTVPYASVNTTEVRPDADSSSPGRQTWSRAGAVFEVSESTPEVTGHADTDGDSSGTVDVNTASVDELAAALPGIGPGKAQRIVDWREANGPFQSVEQLLEVSGIGPKTLENIRPLVRIGEFVSMMRELPAQSTEDAVILALRGVIRKAVRDRSEAIRDDGSL